LRPAATLLYNAGKMKVRLVLVDWVDSYRAPMEWEALDDEPTLLECQSVGWLARENKDCVTIVPHWSQFEHGCGEMTIPRVAIKRIRNLRVSRQTSR
jgi:hypothetical protein